MWVLRVAGKGKRGYPDGRRGMTALIFLGNSSWQRRSRAFGFEGQFVFHLRFWLSAPLRGGTHDLTLFLSLVGGSPIPLSAVASDPLRSFLIDDFVMIPHHIPLAYPPITCPLLFTGLCSGRGQDCFEFGVDLDGSPQPQRETGAGAARRAGSIRDGIHAESRGTWCPMCAFRLPLAVARLGRRCRMVGVAAES